MSEVGRKADAFEATESKLESFEASFEQDWVRNHYFYDRTMRFWARFRTPKQDTLLDISKDYEDEESGSTKMIRREARIHREANIRREAEDSNSELEQYKAIVREYENRLQLEQERYRDYKAKATETIQK